MKDLKLELTLSQQFELRRLTMSSESLKADELRGLLLQSCRLMMVKDNIIKQLMSEAL